MITASITIDIVVVAAHLFVVVIVVVVVVVVAVVAAVVVVVVVVAVVGVAHFFDVGLAHRERPYQYIPCLHSNHLAAMST